MIMVDLNVSPRFNNAFIMIIVIPEMSVVRIEFLYSYGAILVCT